MAIQRRAALIFLHLLDWPSWRGIHEALHEGEMAISEEDPEAARPPFDVAQAEADWQRWHDDLIRRYRLEGLVSPTVTGTEG